MTERQSLNIAGRHGRFMAVSGFFVLSLVALITWEAKRSYRDAIKQAEGDTRNLAQVLENHTVAVVRNVDLLLQDLVDALRLRPAGGEWTTPGLQELVRRMWQRVPESTGIKIIDERGNYLADSSGVLPTANLADRSYFRTLREKEGVGLVISEPLISRVTGLWTFVLARRLDHKDGRFAGIVMCTVQLESLARFYSTLEIGNQGAITLWDMERRVMARYPNREGEIGKQISADSYLGKAIASSANSGTFDTPSRVDGIRRVLSYRKVAGFPLLVTVGLAIDDVLLSWKRATIIYSFLIGLLITGWAFLLFRYLKSLAQIERQQTQAIHSAKMSSLGEMAAGIAHEINNPLSIVLGKADVIEKSALSGGLDPIRTAENAAKIKQTAQRIAKIVRGLRAFARNGEKDPFVPVSFSCVVAETLELCRERFKNHDIELRIGEIPETKIACRESQICQVLLNLLNNAFDAVSGLDEKWVELSVRLEPDANRIRIRVKDSGQGIPPAVAEKIMQPFFTTKDVGKGTGLGLSISKGIVEEHQGEFRLLPDEPNTCFEIVLPVARSDADLTRVA